MVPVGADCISDTGILEAAVSVWMFEKSVSFVAVLPQMINTVKLEGGDHTASSCFKGKQHCGSATEQQSAAFPPPGALILLKANFYLN